MSMIFRALKLEQLSESSVNPRLDMNHDDLAALGESIRAFGILQPLVVQEKAGKFIILAGHRRAMAAAQIGLEKVPCIVRDPVKNAEVAHLVENNNRADLLPAETGIAVHGALKAKVKQMDLAAQLGKSEGWVSKFKTIGEAMAKAKPERIEECGLATTQNSDTAYQLALQLLGRAKVAKPKDERVAIGTKKNRTLEQILNDKFAELGSLNENSYKIKEDGPNGPCTISLEFPNEAFAKYFFTH